MKKMGILILLLSGFLLCLFANSGLLIYKHPGLIALILPGILCANTLPLLATKAPPGKQLWLLSHGNYCLKIFIAATVVSLLFHLYLTAVLYYSHPLLLLFSIFICICVLAVMFWNGIISVYCISSQLGIKLRIIAIVLGFIPIINLIALEKIIIETDKEIRFETEKEELNELRKEEKICKTKYPVLLVHGFFFRDYKYFNYWGRIPGQLKRNGAKIFYGNHPSAASIADCGQILSDRIKEIVQQTGCEKVNIIAHSKGGLDCRYAIEFCGAGPYIASLTTVSTPHRGCKFADYLLTKAPKRTQRHVSKVYNAALRKLGEPESDFMAAVNDLTSSHCTVLDQKMPVPEGILCRSVGSKVNRALGGRFPMNFTYSLVRYFDGDNDGLVGEESFRWGHEYTYLTTNSREGISHCDITDLNRTNLPEFDVREFYVQMVSDLRQRGL